MDTTLDTTHTFVVCGLLVAGAEDGREDTRPSPVLFRDSCHKTVTSQYLVYIMNKEIVIKTSHTEEAVPDCG